MARETRSAPRPSRSIPRYWDLGWVLPDDQQALLLRLTPGAFGDDHFNWAHVRTQVYAWRGDAARARIYADSAIRASAEVLESQPDNAQRLVLLGLALAYAGRIHAQL